MDIIEFSFIFQIVKESHVQLVATMATEPLFPSIPVVVSPPTAPSFAHCAPTVMDSGSCIVTHCILEPWIVALLMKTYPSLGLCSSITFLQYLVPGLVIFLSFSLPNCSLKKQELWGREDLVSYREKQ